jgi:hypothetical protein
MSKVFATVISWAPNKPTPWSDVQRHPSVWGKYIYKRDIWALGQEQQHVGRDEVMKRWFGLTTPNILFRMVVGKRFEGTATKDEIMKITISGGSQ